jgi:hypothetical protein
LDEWDDCAEDFNSNEPCEGDWMTTTCVTAEGEFWWCEDGEWTSEK